MTPLLLAPALAFDPAFVGTWTFEDHLTLVTIPSPARGAQVHIEVSAPTGRRDLACAPIVATEPRAFTCTAAAPSGAGSKPITLRFALADGTQLQMGIVGALPQTGIRLDTTQAGWRATVDARWARAERQAAIRDSLNGLKTALLAYDAAFDQFVAAPYAPRPLNQLNARAVPWFTNAGFEQLGWTTYGPTAAVYAVELDAAGQFTAHAWADADGDGVPAHWTATSTTNATRVSPESVD